MAMNLPTRRNAGGRDNKILLVAALHRFCPTLTEHNHRPALTGIPVLRPQHQGLAISAVFLSLRAFALSIIWGSWSQQIWLGTDRPTMTVTSGG